MDGSAEGPRMFAADGASYDAFMGRYSRALAPQFADAAGVGPGQQALDVGCGPGALTAELVARLGAGAVSAVDPSPQFVDECARRFPGVDVRLAKGEELPFPDASFDVVAAQLVLHFVADGDAAVAQMMRVARSGGTVAACVWDFAEGMQMLRLFWDAALALDPSAPDEARTLRFGRPDEIAAIFRAHGAREVREIELTVSSDYASFDELWLGFCAGIGPAGAYCVSLTDARRAALRAELFAHMGSPAAGFTLSALARSAVAVVA